MPTEVLVIQGAPGVGKTTVSRALKNKLKIALLDLDWIRCNHLDQTWSDASPTEEALSYRILNRTIEEYVAEDYPAVLLNSADIQALFRGCPVIETVPHRIFTLLVDEAELRRRVEDPTRDSGWKNGDGSVSINQRIWMAPALPNETRFNTTGLGPEETISAILALLSVSYSR
jgi:adenylate kinase